MANGSVRMAAAVLAAAAALTANAASAENNCALSRYFELPVTVEGPAAFMDVKIDGVETRFQVDTGAFFSIVTPDGAKRLHLSDTGAPGLQVNGIGGSEDAHVASAKTFDFAGAPLRNVAFVVAGRQFANGAIGLIGENVLGTFAEVDYDFGKGEIGFFKLKDCRGVDVAYWANAAGSDDWIRIDSRPMRGAPTIIGTVTVNGQKMRAVFDTGAHATIMTLSAAERAGLRPESPGVKPSHGARGFGHRTSKTWIAPISSFVIGHEEIKNTQIEFGNIELDEADMLLGIDFFLSHHVFVVHSQDRLYFTYNGGPVFRLDQPEPPAQPLATADAAPAARPADGAAGGQATGATAEPADPDTLDREGAGLMARHEYEAALNAFERAAALEPKTASRWVSRARAELALKRPVLAMSDLDRAVELKPDDVTARMTRGELLLSRGGFEAAQADFEAAAKAAPPGDDVRLRIATAYQRREHWAESIPHLDAWLAAHSSESTAPVALNLRCWARAMLGKDLDKALADCDAAIRRDREPGFLDSRGMVHLRLGQLQAAIEDYDATLRAAPNLAWSLYGRGLAKQRLGQTTEGEADIQAATALQPKLPDEARRIGLVDGPPAPDAKPAHP